jgi:AraC-like DNA-binding protein
MRPYSEMAQSKLVNMFPPPADTALYIRQIVEIKDETAFDETRLPFFADGLAGMMLQETESGLTVMPHNKRMPEVFLYGQTIQPIELNMHGPYRLIVFELFPFVLRSFFGVDARTLNDNCYDLGALAVSRGLQPGLASSTEEKIRLLTDFLRAQFLESQQHLDMEVRQAMGIIIEHRGQISIGDLCAQLHLTERTLERRFIGATGISMKQFARITQFQGSLDQLKTNEYDKLTDIVYANGFADQSHFIRLFKKYTGTTPRKFGA